MEKEGLERGLNHMKGYDVEIHEFVTDRHPQVVK
jgi:hypothetical protein